MSNIGIFLLSVCRETKPTHNLMVSTRYAYNIARNLNISYDEVRLYAKKIGIWIM